MKSTGDLSDPQRLPSRAKALQQVDRSVNPTRPACFNVHLLQLGSCSSRR